MNILLLPKLIPPNYLAGGLAKIEVCNVIREAPYLGSNACKLDTSHLSQHKIDSSLRGDLLRGLPFGLLIRIQE